ncbi:MAG TPA: glycosyltransferase [Aestuariivirgaceae bacterium]|nr:glycosyltransferase [Aestuariivirgaceae bacterium]
MKAVSGGSVRIVLLTGHLSHAAGGLSVSVPGMARSLARLPETSIHIVGVRDRRAPCAGAPHSENMHSHPEYGPRKFHWAPGISRALDSIDPDLIDVQGIRMHQSLVNLRRHRRTRRPYVVTPRGMLDFWTLQRSAWKKQVVGRLFENEHLRRAACLRALTAAEAEVFRAHGLTNPIAVVPNGVEIDMAGPLATRANSAPVLLFLGRLDPKKGVEELLQAWAMVQAGQIGAGWRLQVTGWGEAAYVSYLQRLANEFSLGSTVSFTGPLYGAQKAMAFRNAAGFILPSFSEGLPMTVLEAWSWGTPVLMTAECNVPEGFAAGAALRITPEPRALAQSLIDFMAVSTAERNAMGAAGRRLVENRFTWARVATEMHAVYEWVLGSGPRPSFVAVD